MVLELPLYGRVRLQPDRRAARDAALRVEHAHAKSCGKPTTASGPPVPLASEPYEQARATGFRFPETLEGWIDPSWPEFAQRRSAQVPWISDPLRRRVRDFERMLNAFYPTSTDIRLTGLRKAALKAASGWRYALRVYALPVEPDRMQAMLTYQRPEKSRF